MSCTGTAYTMGETVAGISGSVTVRIALTVASRAPTGSVTRKMRPARGVQVGRQASAAAPRRHFLHIRHGLVEHAIVRRDYDHRHLLVDQRDRPVLELAAGVALGVDVRNFLELERALGRQREAGAAA